MIAICTIRREPTYRRGAFEMGLKRTGYSIVERGRPSSKADLLVMWNRQGAAEATANTWEACGGTVLVCENGYAGRDAAGRQFYAISVHGHNGSGWYPEGGEDRFAALGIDLAPWRTEGYDLVCGQRGIGSKAMASPTNWETRAQLRLKALHRKTLVRRHPGNKPPATKLEDELERAATCVIWSSSSGVKALTMGVPVVYDAPHWIAEGCAVRGVDNVANAIRDDEARLKALRKMAWGQRSVEEIESGEPFATIRERIGEATW